MGLGRDQISGLYSWGYWEIDSRALAAQPPLRPTANDLSTQARSTLTATDGARHSINYPLRRLHPLTKIAPQRLIRQDLPTRLHSMIRPVAPAAQPSCSHQAWASVLVRLNNLATKSQHWLNQ
jgi:hypothetical protein